MADKKKRHFVQLTLIFMLITMVALYDGWSNNRNSNVSAMTNNTMGSMMKMMHANGISIPDLFRQEERMMASQNTDSHSSHHSEKLQSLHYIITSTIIILLPLIIAGTVFLAVVWFK